MLRQDQPGQLSEMTSEMNADQCGAEAGWKSWLLTTDALCKTPALSARSQHKRKAELQSRHRCADAAEL